VTHNEATLAAFYTIHNPDRVDAVQAILQQYSLEDIVGLSEQRYGASPEFVRNNKRVIGVLSPERKEQQRAIIQLELVSKELEGMAEEERLVWKLQAEERTAAQAAIKEEKETAVQQHNTAVQQHNEYANELQHKVVEYERRMELMQEDTAAAVAAKERAELDAEEVHHQLELTRKWGGSPRAVELEEAYRRKMGSLEASNINWKAAAVREAAADKRMELQQAEAQQLDDQETLLVVEERVRLRQEKGQPKDAQQGNKLVLMLHPLAQLPKGQNSMELLRRDISNAVGGEAKMQTSRVHIGRDSISHCTIGIGSVEQPEVRDMVLVEVTIAEPDLSVEAMEDDAGEVEFCGSASSVGSASEIEVAEAAEAQAREDAQTSSMMPTKVCIVYSV
jgi:hypothetical protein